jgi:hypothetical protein
MPDVDRPGLRLSDQVRARLRELLDGRVCCRCGEPAARLTGSQFFCAPHFTRKSHGRPGPARVYRLSTE